MVWRKWRSMTREFRAALERDGAERFSIILLETHSHLSHQRECMSERSRCQRAGTCFSKKSFPGQRFIVEKGEQVPPSLRVI